MTESATTHFSSQADILGELWLNYRNDEEFVDFIEYNDLGLPLAYAIANDIIPESPRAKQFVEETFALLLSALEIEDTGFESLDDLLTQAEQ